MLSCTTIDNHTVFLMSCRAKIVSSKQSGQSIQLFEFCIALVSCPQSKTCLMMSSFLLQLFRVQTLNTKPNCCMLCLDRVCALQNGHDASKAGFWLHLWLSSRITAVNSSWVTVQEISVSDATA